MVQTTPETENLFFFSLLSLLLLLFLLLLFLWRISSLDNWNNKSNKQTTVPDSTFCFGFNSTNDTVYVYSFLNNKKNEKIKYTVFIDWYVCMSLIKYNYWNPTVEWSLLIWWWCELFTWLVVIYKHSRVKFDSRNDGYLFMCLCLYASFVCCKRNHHLSCFFFSEKVRNCTEMVKKLHCRFIYILVLDTIERSVNLS